MGQSPHPAITKHVVETVRMKTVEQSHNQSNIHLVKQEIKQSIKLSSKALHDSGDTVQSSSTGAINYQPGSQSEVLVDQGTNDSVDHSENNQSLKSTLLDSSIDKSDDHLIDNSINHSLDKPAEPDHQTEMALIKEFIRDIERLVGKYLTRVLIPLIEIKQSINPSIKQSINLSFRSALVLSLLTLLSVICLASSITMYSILYHWSIPMLSVNLPINFDYSMSQPVALVALTPQQWSNHQSSGQSISHQSINPYDLFLTPGQHYHVWLKLELPDSTINQNMGVITVHSQMQHRTFIDRFNQPQDQSINQIQSLASSTRSFLVPYRNSLIQSISRLVWCVPMLLGLVDDAHVISLQLFDNFLESSSNLNKPSTHLQIELATPRAHLLQLQSASVQFDAHLSGLTGLMYNWPIITSIVIVSFLFSAQMICLIVCLTVVVVVWNRKVYAPLAIDHFNQSINRSINYSSPQHNMMTESEPGNDIAAFDYDTLTRMTDIPKAPRLKHRNQRFS